MMTHKSELNKNLLYAHSFPSITEKVKNPKTTYWSTINYWLKNFFFDLN